MVYNKAQNGVQETMRRVPAAKIQLLPEDRAWIADRIQEVLSTGQLTLGKYGSEFERQFALSCGGPHAVAVNSGTGSLLPVAVLLIPDT